MASAADRVVFTRWPDKLRQFISHRVDFRGCPGLCPLTLLTGPWSDDTLPWSVGWDCVEMDSGGGVTYKHPLTPPGRGGRRRQGGTQKSSSESPKWSAGARGASFLLSQCGALQVTGHTPAWPLGLMLQVHKHSDRNSLLSWAFPVPWAWQTETQGSAQVHHPHGSPSARGPRGVKAAHILPATSILCVHGEAWPTGRTAIFGYPEWVTWGPLALQEAPPWALVQL